VDGLKPVDDRVVVICVPNLSTGSIRELTKFDDEDVHRAAQNE
jgi:hypothetical protein